MKISCELKKEEKLTFAAVPKDKKKRNLEVNNEQNHCNKKTEEKTGLPTEPMLLSSSDPKCELTRL